MGERPAPHAQCRAAQNKRARWGATGDAGSGKRKPGQMEGGRAEKPAGGGVAPPSVLVAGKPAESEAAPTSP